MSKQLDSLSTLIADVVWKQKPGLANGDMTAIAESCAALADVLGNMFSAIERIEGRSVMLRAREDVNKRMTEATKEYAKRAREQNPQLN